MYLGWPGSADPLTSTPWVTKLQGYTCTYIWWGAGIETMPYQAGKALHQLAYISGAFHKIKGLEENSDSKWWSEDTETVHGRNGF